ncbi:MAG TPA: SGNH/GDSL hydrolase family protein [Candidatus Dormibacteraeota bacterium]|jgi:hypothetical protein|nr:SGNH/GDSL hydrolase family protein [Candidatus Dormibacteraeota bacterium]
MLSKTLLIGVLFCTQLGSSTNVGCGIAGGDGCTRVLFVGNSFTYVNDLPGMFAALAGSGGHRVEVGMAASGGWTLADHVASTATAGAIASEKWDTVVLQEQSQIPSVARYREDQMYPAVRQLVSAIRADGSEPMLFLTWAHRDGWPENGLPDYWSMQSEISKGYLTIGADQQVPVAPVGYAWSLLVGEGQGSALWQGDGVHPTSEGTYLAACVFYATIFKQSPKGLPYKADLSLSTAALVQGVASDSVLVDSGGSSAIMASPGVMY